MIKVLTFVFAIGLLTENSFALDWEKIQINHAGGSEWSRFLSSDSLTPMNEEIVDYLDSLDKSVLYICDAKLRTSTMTRGFLKALYAIKNCHPGVEQ